MPSSLRSLPSVDRFLGTTTASAWIDEYGRRLTVDAIRKVLEDVRGSHTPERELPGEDELLASVGETLARWTRPSLQPVINASGVILHTNLGRAPLSSATLKAIESAAAGYSNLEYDLENGKRGSRLVHAEELVRLVIGAEAALVVNNNAAAVLLVLTALARRRKVVIARSQLVEIGGGFRIPDVMKQSGANLLEVGATNRVHLYDYEAALGEAPAVILHAHRSNFRLLGFTEEPELAEIAALAHQAGIPFVDDQGSGALLDTEQYGLEHEPTVQESLAAGADLVCFSGDKLLGGPQAGIIVGKADLISKLRKHPLARAIRADKLCLAGLSATLLHYLVDRAEQEIPIWRMISMPLGEIDARARAWQEVLGCGEVIDGESTVGGGSLPGENLPTKLLAIAVKKPSAVMKSLRLGQPAVVARTLDDRIVFDPRTVLDEQESILLERIRQSIHRDGG